MVPLFLLAQNKEINGTVTNAAGQPVAGVSVLVLGTFNGTTTDANGKYSIKVTPGKNTLVFSAVGSTTQNVAITDATAVYDIKFLESSSQLDAVITSASRVSERIMETPVTVESINKRQLEINPSADLLSGLSRYKGIDVSQSSFLLGSFSTRGFNSAKSERVIQMIDNVDYMDPSLSLYAGNIMGIPEIDIETVDIIHGANSALYGANAFNGVINQISKDPFKYEGLTLAVRGGSRSLLDLNARLAVKLTPKLAFKINATYLKADEFIADSEGARSLGLVPNNNPAGSSLGWDAINRYGDIGINPNTLASANMLRAAGFPTVNGTPTGALKTFFSQGFTERDLLGPDFEAKNIRVNPSLHYLITNKIKASYEYRSGNGAAIYQSSNRYSFDKYVANLNKFEVKSDKWALRAYRNADKPGRIYDLSFWGTGIVAQERYTPGPNPSAVETAVFNSIAASNPVYATVFAGTYTNAFLSARNNNQSVDQALAFARAQSANVVPFAGPSDPRFNANRTTIRDSKTGNFKPQIGPNSFFWDYSGQYELPVKIATVIVGGSYRKYTLRSDGTLFSDGAKSPQGKPVRNSISNDEVGGYAQVQKALLKDMLKLSAAARVDNFQNFGTRFSPRISGVLTLGDNRQHNIRVNYAQAYRSPAQIDQYITLDIGQILLLGNIGSGFQALPLNIGALLAANPGSTPKTFEYRVSNLKPEKVNTYEVGYKALISPKVFVDLSFYRSNYDDFIGTTRFIGREDGTSPSLTPDASNAPTNRNRSRAMQVWINADKAVKTKGLVVAFDFFLNKAFNITTNYTLSKIDGLDNTAPITAVPGLILGFNTPEHKFNFGINGKITNNLSYSTNLRSISSYNYFMPFDEGLIKGFTTVDAQFTYKVPKANSTFRLGATNIGDVAAFQAYGAAPIGRIVYAGVIFDSNIFKKK